MAKTDKGNTCVTTHSGIYRYSRIPFGLRNFPATFQRTFNIVLSGIGWHTWFIYLDDLIILSTDEAQHVKVVDKILDLLREAGVSLKQKKCVLLRSLVEYLGHTSLPVKLAEESKPKKEILQIPFGEDRTKFRWTPGTWEDDEIAGEIPLSKAPKII